MFVTCPNCSTQFFVSASALGEGKTVRCSKCAHQWFQEPETQDEDIPLSVMPRAQELDEEGDGGFDWRVQLKAFQTKLEAFQEGKPREFAAILGALPFLLLSFIVLILLMPKGPDFPTLPEGMSMEGMEIAVGEEGALLRGLVVNLSHEDRPAPIFTIRSDEGGYEVTVQDLVNQTIPALSEIELVIPITDWAEGVEPVSIFLSGFAEPITSQVQDMSADTDPGPAHSDAGPHHSDEHHNRLE